MSHWNYRVIEFTEGPAHWRAVHEVYYNDEDKPVAYGASAGVHWDVTEGDAAPLNILARIREALEKPILTPSDMVDERR